MHHHNIDAVDMARHELCYLCTLLAGGSSITTTMVLTSVMSLLTTRGRGVDHDVRETTDTEQGTTEPTVNNQLNTAQHMVLATLRMRTTHM